MTIYNFGSINIDHFYRVPHLPGPGETLSATGHDSGLGGKGANQSVAAALAGSHVVHIGMVGPDGAGREALAGFGVDVAHVGRAGTITGHANIHVDPTGENMIVVLPGANHEQSFDSVRAALAAGWGRAITFCCRMKRPWFAKPPSSRGQMGVSWSIRPHLSIRLRRRPCAHMWI
jgi:ribokinase